MSARLSPGQKVYDAFALLEFEEQVEVLEHLAELHRFTGKRDGKLKRKARAKSEPAATVLPLMPPGILCEDCNKPESAHVGSDHEFRWVPF